MSNTELIILKYRTHHFNADFIICNADFIIFNTGFIIFNTEFIILIQNVPQCVQRPAQVIIHYH